MKSISRVIFPDFFFSFWLAVHSLVKITSSLHSVYLCVASMCAERLRCRLRNFSMLVLVNLDLCMHCWSVPDSGCNVYSLGPIHSSPGQALFLTSFVRPDLPFLNAQRRWHQPCAALIPARILCLLRLSWGVNPVCWLYMSVWKYPDQTQKEPLDWHCKFPSAKKP